MEYAKQKGLDPNSDAAQCTLAGLMPYVAEERRKEFASHVDSLVDGDECFGIDHTFLGFICDYVNYAHLVRRKAEIHNLYEPGRKLLPPITVFDVGCATALQHVVFDSRIHYVGIDYCIRKPKFFSRQLHVRRGTLPGHRVAARHSSENSHWHCEHESLLSGFARRMRVIRQDFQMQVRAVGKTVERSL